MDKWLSFIMGVVFSFCCVAFILAAQFGGGFEALIAACVGVLVFAAMFVIDENVELRKTVTIDLGGDIGGKPISADPFDNHGGVFRGK